MSEPKCMNCKGQDIFEGECLSCGYEVESAVQFVSDSFAESVTIDNSEPITDGPVESVRGIPVPANILPVMDAETEQTPRRIQGSFKGVPFVMESIKRDSHLADEQFVQGSGVAKPNLCKHKAEFLCSASMSNQMNRCQYFSAHIGLSWSCISRDTNSFACLNPTARHNALRDQAKTVEQLSTRIAELEAKWAGANLEAHGILKLIHGLMSNWGGSLTDFNRLEQLLDKAASKFGWDKKE